MPNQQIIEYISGQLKLGVSQSVIRTALMQNGWLPSDVDAAFAALRPVQTVTPPAPPAPSFNQQPISAQPNPIVNKGSQVVYVNSSPKGGRKAFVIVISILILLGLCGGTVWAYMNFISPDPQQTVNKSMSKLADAIEKGYFDNTGTIEIKGDGISPTMGSVSLDVNGSANFQGDIKNNKSSGKISLNAKANYAGIAFNVSGDDFLDAYMSGNSIFVRLNKIPSGLEMFTRSIQPQIDMINKEVVGKWIKIDKEQLAKLQQASSGNVSASLSYTNNVNASSTGILLKALSTSNIYDVVQTLPSENLNGKSVFHYKIKLDKVGLTNFVVAVSAGTKDVNVDNIGKNIDNALTTLDQAGIKLDMDLWVERYSKLPAKFTLGVDLGSVPQFKMSGINNLVVTLGTSYNFPSTLNLVEPESSVNLSDLLNSLGMVSAGNDAYIKSNIANIRAYAEIFYDSNKNSYTGVCSYPGVVSLLSNIQKASGSVPTCNVSKKGQSYAVESSLASNSKTYFCIDSTGVATTTQKFLSNSTLCL